MNLNTRLWFIKQKLKNNFFSVGILFAILFAKLEPAIGKTGGVLKPEITVKYLVVGIIFYLSGLSLKTEELTKTIFQFRLHFFIQGFTLIFIPISIYLLTFLLSILNVNEWILKGLITVSCLPPPVSSAVILTKAVGGNEAVAVFNSAFGSFLGITITPTLLFLFVRRTVQTFIRSYQTFNSQFHIFVLDVSSSTSFTSTISQLTFTVTLPLVAGQATRFYAQMSPKKRGPGIFKNLGSCLLLFIIYTTFCETFSHNDLNLQLTTLLFTIFLVGLIQLSLLSFAFWLSNHPVNAFPARDTIAVIFCATHKSLTLGIPMLKILFSDYPYLSTMSIPLLIYHPLQIIIGGVLVEPLRTWMIQKEKRNGKFLSSI